MMNRSKLNLLLAGYGDNSVTVTYLNELENDITWYKKLYEDSCTEYENCRQKETKTTEKVRDLATDNRRLKTELERELTRGRYLTESRKCKVCVSQIPNRIRLGVHFRLPSKFFSTESKTSDRLFASSTVWMLGPFFAGPFASPTPPTAVSSKQPYFRRPISTRSIFRKLQIDC